MTLPARLLDSLAGRLFDALESSELGHCVRVDNLNPDDCLGLWSAMRGRSSEVAIHILGDNNTEDGHEIKAERAVELRNRKAVRLGLLVPSGAGASGPSSLTNSFAPFDLGAAFGNIAKELVTELPDELALAVMQVRYAVRGSLNPSSEQWAAYVASVAGQPTFVQAGVELWQVGLIPDAGGEAFPSRLEDNRRCTLELSRPLRAHSSAAERLGACRLEPGVVRQSLLEFLTAPSVQLRLARTWMRSLAEPDQVGRLTFERWPLTEGQESDLRSIEIAPFVLADGTLAKGNKLHQSEPGAMPTARLGPKEVVVISWTSVPKAPAGVHRWSAELVPSRDEVNPDDVGASELPSSKVRASARKASVGLDLDPDVLPTTIMQVRLAALDEFGAELLDEHGHPIEALSQEFALDSTSHEESDDHSRAARAKVISLGYGRLTASVELPLDDLIEDSVIWIEGDFGEFGVRIGGRKTIRIEYSSVLKQLQESILSTPSASATFRADVEIGERIDLAVVTKDPSSLPAGVDAFAARRKEFFAELESRAPRHLIETASWDEVLRRRARSYVSSFRAALDRSDSESATQLLAIDTLEVSVLHQHRTHRALLLLPTHPARVAWMAVYDELLGTWAEQILDAPLAERAARVELALVGRLAPLNVPATVPTSSGELFLFHQNLQFLTGLYVDPSDRLPSTTAAAVAGAVGVKSGASGVQVPPRLLADRIELFRSCHPYVDALRLVAINPGPGALLANALRAVCSPPTGDEEFRPLPRCEVVAFDESAAEPRPVPEVLEWQEELYGQQPRGRHSFLAPLLTVTARRPAELRNDPISAHLAVVTDVGVPEVALGDEVIDGDSGSCYGLLARQLSEFVAAEEGLLWKSQFHFSQSRRSGAPTLSADLLEVQQANLNALCRVLGGDPNRDIVEIRTRLGPEDLSTVEALHASADWVVTVDRYLGLETFDSPADAYLGARSRKYVLDHAPDFLDGVGHRLSITTGHRAELELVLARAMEDLGFGLVKETVGGVLDDLRTVSGRLALRILGDDAHAREAVSLGVVITYLRTAGQLQDTILVPVDAHPELFGPAARPAVEGARRARCDLLAVRFTPRTLQMEFIEVKSRTPGAQLEPLFERIADQCAATDDLIRDLFFRSENPRADHVLQRSRLSTILRHYLHRSYRNGVIGSRDRVAEISAHIDRLETGFPELKSLRTGYIVTLGGEPQATVDRRGTTIKVLTADDLHQAGYSSSQSPPPDGTSSSGPTTAPHPGPSPSTRPPGPTAPGAGSQETAEGEPKPASGSLSVTPTMPVATNPPTNEAHEAADRAIQAELGTIVGTGETLTWRISVTGSPHLFILGIPGQGKSVAVQRLLKAFAIQELPVLVIDFHGQFGAGSDSLHVLNAAGGLPFSPFEADAGKGPTSWRTTAYAVAEIFQYLCDLGDIQRDVVYTALKSCYEANGFADDSAGVVPSISQFSDALELAEAERKIKNVVPRCRPLLDFGLFRDAPQTDLADLVRQGLVIDVHNLGLETVQQAAGAFVLRKVYRDMFRWGETDRLRLAIVLDEAHRLSKDVTLPKLMKEGRKFGIAVVVASQGLSDFHQDVVGNAGTKVVFRTNFPQSKKVSQFLRGRAGTDLASMIEQLDVGEAVVSTPALEIARKVHMYPLDPPT